jgi:hypothetical protein
MIKECCNGTHQIISLIKGTLQTTYIEKVG